jgi:hypothetical protein
VAAANVSTITAFKASSTQVQTALEEQNGASRTTAARW